MIEPSASPWASPIVLVQKKDGSTRFCVDYWKLNDVTRKDAYPLPRIDATLDTLHGSRWFSTLDLRSQVEVAEEDRPKTTLCTTEGLFQFRVMPFGLCNAQKFKNVFLLYCDKLSALVLSVWYRSDPLMPGDISLCHGARTGELSCMLHMRCRHAYYTC